jgi:hypothetical protein
MTEADFRKAGKNIRRNPKTIFLGCNWAVSAGQIKGIGGFDVNYGPGSATGAGGQERAAQLKLLARGSTPRFLPGNPVRHIVPGDRCSLPWLKDRYCRAGVAFRLRNDYLRWLHFTLKTGLRRPARGSGYALARELVRGFLAGRRGSP